MESKNIVVVGSTGILGTAITEMYKNNNLRLVLRNEISTWMKSGSKEIMQFLNELEPQTIIFYTVGDVNPNHSLDELRLLNSELPLMLKAALENSELKLITFGTILENYEHMAGSNNYVRSKREFLKLGVGTSPGMDHLHIQLHTLYGSTRTHPTSLLHQISESILTKTKFRMSSGTQYREYHHICDEMAALGIIVESNIHGIIELNSGMPVKIRDLAKDVFGYFDLSHLLEFDSSMDRPDVLIPQSVKTPLLNDVDFRHPFLGVRNHILQMEKFKTQIAENMQGSTFFL